MSTDQDSAKDRLQAWHELLSLVVSLSTGSVVVMATFLRPEATTLPKSRPLAAAAGILFVFAIILIVYVKWMLADWMISRDADVPWSSSFATRGPVGLRGLTIVALFAFTAALVILTFFIMSNVL